MTPSRRLLACCLVVLAGLAGACARFETQRPEVSRRVPASQALTEVERALESAHHAVMPAARAQNYLIASSKASAIVFDARPHSPAERERARQIHNEALEHFLRLTKARRWRLGPEWVDRLNEQGLRVTVRGAEPGARRSPDFQVEFANDHSARPLRNHFREEGLGVPMFSVRHRHAYAPERLLGLDRFYPPLEVHPLTLVLRRSGTDLNAEIELVDPLVVNDVPSPSGQLPIASDLSVPLAYQFNLTRQPLVEWFMSLDPDHLNWTAGLHTLHTYEPGKIPVVLIHGYGSSPRCWLQTVNELRADPEIRARYQFLVYVYPSLNPFLHTASILRRSLDDFRRQFDPNRSDPALSRMVLVGHSVGGIMAKSMVQETGSRLWNLISERPLDQMIVSPEHRELLSDALMVHDTPDVARVVFIATPHRGTRFSGRYFGRISARLTPHPGRLAEAYEALRLSNPRDHFSTRFLDPGLATSFDQFHTEDAVLEVFSTTPIAPGVAAHSIIAQRFPGPVETGSDGVVDYASSHIDDVDSELIIPSHHFVQESPAAVAELKRILFLHLAPGPGRR